jgi:hypothetical protein
MGWCGLTGHEALLGRLPGVAATDSGLGRIGAASAAPSSSSRRYVLHVESYLRSTHSILEHDRSRQWSAYPFFNI